MDFGDTPEEAQWRKEVRDFLEKEYPAELRPGGGPRTRGAPRGENEGEGMFRSKDANQAPPMQRWRQALAERGWVAPAWPKEYGGAGLDTKRQFVMNEEFAEFGAMNVGGFGTLMLGNYPALRSLGTVALFGSITCLFTSLTLVPALMAVRKRERVD